MKDHESSEVKLLQTPSERENGIISDCGMNSQDFNNDELLDNEIVRETTERFYFLSFFPYNFVI